MMKGLQVVKMIFITNSLLNLSHFIHILFPIKYNKLFLDWSEALNNNTKIITEQKQTIQDQKQVNEDQKEVIESLKSGKFK